MGRIRLSREFSYEQEEIRDRLSVIEPRIQQLKLKSLSYESQIGPISYVAKMLQSPQDNIVFYAILMLVFVADPLAVTLTVACNMALLRFLDHPRPSRAKRIPKGKRVATMVANAVLKLREMAAETHKGIKAKNHPTPAKNRIVRGKPALAVKRLPSGR